jgi:hypothetical protein
MFKAEFSIWGHGASAVRLGPHLFRSPSSQVRCTGIRNGLTLFSDGGWVPRVVVFGLGSWGSVGGHGR